MTIAIAGASGNLGRKAADFILETTEPDELVLVTRSPASLAEYSARGVDVRFGDFDKPDGLAAAFAGVDRLLLISATDVGRRIPQHVAAIDAAKAAGVRKVTYTSSTNPTPANPAAVAEEHGATEEALKASGIEWTILRNSIYADLQVAAILAALPAGRFVHNNGDGRCAFVARDDCAAVAAAVLTTDGHDSQIYDVTGPELLSAADMARAVSEATGSSIEVIAVDDAAYVAGLVEQTGMPPEAAESLATFGRAIREGQLAQLSNVVERLTGLPATRFNELVAASVPVAA